MTIFAELTDSLVPRQAGDTRPVLHLFGGPFVTFGDNRVEVPEGSKRLLVFVALRQGLVERRRVADSLWPGGDNCRTAGNLRSALWRLNKAGLGLLISDQRSLTLGTNVVVDVHVVNEWASRVLSGSVTQDELMVMPGDADALDLLPGWYEDWVLTERERIRQRMLHALEALSSLLVQAGRTAEGVEAAMTAVAVDPLRESAQRALIEAHVSEHNWVEARRQFDIYRATLLREVGVEPDERLASLVRDQGRR